MVQLVIQIKDCKLLENFLSLVFSFFSATKHKAEQIIETHWAVLIRANTAVGMRDFFFFFFIDKKSLSSQHEENWSENRYVCVRYTGRLTCTELQSDGDWERMSSVRREGGLHW